MAVEKISNRQFNFIIFISRSTVVVATLPVLTAASEVRQDAWLSGLLVFAGTVLLVLLIAGLGVLFPGRTVVEISHKLWGRLAGSLLSLVILWAFLHLSAVEVRIYSEMIIVGFLLETPIIFVTSSMVFAAVISAYMGIETIGRIADLIFPVFIGIIIITLFALGVEADFRNLQPVLAQGFQPALTGSLVPIAFSSQLMVIGMLIPNLINPQKAVRSSLWAVAGASFIILVMVVLVLGVLGPDEGQRAVFPFFKALRGIQISEFLERIEILAVFTWGFGLFVAISTLIYCGARGLSQVFNISDYRHLLLPLGVIWVVLAIRDFDNMFELRSFISPDIFGIYGLFLVLFPYLMLWGSYLFRRLSGGDPAAEEAEEK